MTAEQERLVAILRYLEDWDKISRTPVTNVQNYRAGLFVFQHEITQLPEIRTNVVGGDGEPVWLEIPRLQRKSPPLPDESLRSWVVLTDDPSGEPRHHDFIEVPPAEGEEEGQTLEFTDELLEAFDVYAEGQWRPWAESEAKKRKCIALYERLFRLQQTIESAGTETPIEIVWGMGMAVWSASGQRICHPLLTQQVEILPLEGSMSLRLRPTTRDPQIETDAFLPLEIPELPGFEKMAHECFAKLEATPSPFEAESFDWLARRAAEMLNPSGRYWPDEMDYVSGDLPEMGPNLVVTDSWVIFARARTTNFLVDDLHHLQESVEEGVPDGAPSYLVEEPSGALPEPPEFNYRGLSTAGASPNTNGFQELYFPKPFNDEQVEIIRRLDVLPGVVVQGPPGTGKTHTIANVICHYLAHGKRVLVTSKGETALSVLQSQIPEPIRQLTVSLLTNEREGKDQLERAVNNINSKLTTLRSSELQSEIVNLDHAIETLHGRIATNDSELRAWAQKNTGRTPESIGGLSPEALAREVCALEETYGWFPDTLDHRPEHEPAVSDIEIGALAEARLLLQDQIQYAGLILPDIGSLPAAAKMAVFHEDLCEQGKLTSAIDHAGMPRLPGYDEETVTIATLLHLEVRDHLGLIAICEEGWLSELRPRFRSLQNGANEIALQHLESLKKEALQLELRLRPYFTTAIDLPESTLNDRELRVAIAKAAEGKRPFPLLALSKKALRQAFQEIRVNGGQPNSTAEWKLVADYCQILEEGRGLASRWNKLAQEIGAPGVEGPPERCVRKLGDFAKAVESAMTLACNYDMTLDTRVRRVFPSFHQDRISCERSFLSDLEKSLQIQLRRIQLASSKQTVISLIKLLSALDGDLFQRMVTWLENILGHTEYSAETILGDWEAFLRELENLHDCTEAFATVQKVAGIIESLGAKEWARRLKSEAVAGGTDPLLPDNWKEAWQWARKKGYLEGIDGRTRILQLAGDRRDAETSLRHAYEEVIEKRTWLRLVEALRLDKAIGRAITAYVQAIRGMTKSGKGKRDVKLRFAAREAMHLASRGVPCWIMPHWRVSEALPPKLGDFDLVIVDEASQSDAWAIPTILRGKKVLIVGDDKQVGPQPSFTRQEQIDQIQERLRTAGLPSDIRTKLDPKESIYDLGELVFAGHTIRLREHFRCAEPIIEFSNKLCYDGEIKCVRVPTSNERLLPTLIDVYVRSGRRDPVQKINRAEAGAIVEEISRLIVDPTFKDRSIGVVSLLGPDQGKLIFDNLLEKIGEEEFLKHRIRCGDARTFQGSEADVIFISAVDDASSGGVMTSNKLDNIRRVNVAVSRARDRLYFFHSFDRSDLSAVDLRARLMDHFRYPIQGLAVGRGRDLCESEFEREMYDLLTRRGYRVLPQVRAGSYRIDLVVEGHHAKRLAVECDGDQYHGPDKWMQDIGRQRLLERAGWRFWRCWGSSFSRDPQGCLKDLIKTLAEGGIEPIGSGPLDFADLVEFREIGVDDTQPSEIFAEYEGAEAHPAEVPLATEPPPQTHTTGITVSIGDVVRFLIADSKGIREDYVMILDRPSNPTLGIVSADDPLSKIILGRSKGEKFSAELQGQSVTIEILMKHAVT